MKNSADLAELNDGSFDELAADVCRQYDAEEVVSCDTRDATSTAPENSRCYEPVRFSLRTLMIVIAAVSIVLGVTLWHYRGLKGTHLSAVRDAYVHGRITIDEAREQVGNVTDSWPEDVHQRAKAAREQRRK